MSRAHVRGQQHSETQTPPALAVLLLRAAGRDECDPTIRMGTSELVLMAEVWKRHAEPRGSHPPC